MAIEVTDRMIEAGQNAAADMVLADDTRRIIAAAFALIDPVPNHITTIFDREGDEWHRNPNDAMVWVHEMGAYYRSLVTIIPEYGPVTWEGKDL